MSAPILTGAAVVAATGWLVLPLLPSLRELRRRRDARPLDVPAESRVDTRHLAQRFRNLVQVQLEEALESSRTTRRPVDGKLESGEIFTVLPGGDAFVPLNDEIHRRRCNRLVASDGVLRLLSPLYHEREIYAQDTLHVAKGLTLRAALAERGIHLGIQTKVLRWVHAGECLNVGVGSTLHGRASAGVSIVLEGPCSFERMRAESIEVGSQEMLAGWRAAPGPLREIDVSKLAGFRSLAAGRALIEGDVALPEGSLLVGDLVAWGNVRIGRNSIVRGSVKSHGAVVVLDGCRVEGALVANHDIRISRGCRIDGPVLAEGAMIAGSRCQFGDALRPVTVRAQRVELRLGSVAHGVVWATESGKVVA